MSYCRFENTARDLADCAEHICDPLRGTEAAARLRLVISCKLILEAAGFDIDMHQQPTFPEDTED